MLFAYDELVWKGGSVGTASGFINGGNIGVNYPGLSPTGFSLAFGTSARGIMSPGSQAAADSVRADDAQDIFYDLFANTTNPSFGATVVNANPMTADGNYPYSPNTIIQTALLPVFPFTPNRALTNGAADLQVGGAGGLSSPQTIAPGPFRDVRFNDGVVVNFGPGVYDMRDVSIGKNVTVNVTDQTIFQIDENFEPNDGLLFGTNLGHTGKARLFVGGFGNNVSTTQTTNFSHDAIIHMQYFAPTAWLDLGGGNQLFGRFWAQRISGDPNNNVTMVVPEAGGALMLAMAWAALGVGRRRR